MRARPAPGDVSWRSQKSSLTVVLFVHSIACSPAANNVTSCLLVPVLLSLSLVWSGHGRRGWLLVPLPSGSFTCLPPVETVRLSPYSRHTTTFAARTCSFRRMLARPNFASRLLY